MSGSARDAVDIHHLRSLARKRLPRALFNALDHGSEDDVSFHHNRRILERIKLVHRVLNDVSGRDASVELFDRTLAMPLIVGPTGVTSWVSHRGEVALARAAADANVPFVLTSTTDTPMETVRRASQGSLWYQAIIWRDTEATLAGIMRAQRAGLDALVLTVDSTIPYNRPHDERNRLTFPMNLRPSNLLESVKRPLWTFGTATRYLLEQRSLPRMTNVSVPDGLSAQEKRKFFVKDDSLTWDFLARVRELWKGSLVVKGLLHPDDALRAIDEGADAVVVSNHGGGTNDAAPSPLEMLPAVAAAVGGRAPVLVDSGFRRGSDIVKAVALGADAVLVGRATLYGLGAGGQVGAGRALAILHKEVARMMGVLGVNRVAEIGARHLMLPAELDHVRRTLDGTWDSPLLGAAARLAAGSPAPDAPLGGPAAGDDLLTMASVQGVRS